MADTGKMSSCDDMCGCPSPCPGGEGCKCIASGGDPSMQHSYCRCGSHCSCNPCRCAKTEDSSGAGKAFCKCGEGCTCATCTT